MSRAVTMLIYLGAERSGPGENQVFVQRGVRSSLFFSLLWLLLKADMVIGSEADAGPGAL